MTGAPDTATLLIVDDEPKLRELLERFLTRVGFAVESCENAEQAIERFQAGPERFRLVVTDLTLPGADGEELLVRLRAIRPGMKAVLTSGYPHQTQAPDTCFLQKPFLPQALVTAVKEMLGERGA